jgi:multiple sugar transport system permease protein
MATPDRGITYRFRRNFLPYLLVLPTLATMTVVLLYPIARVVVMSFHKIDLRDPLNSGGFVGLRNYITFLNNPAFWSSVRITLLLTLGTLIGAYVIGLLIALLLNEPLPGRALARGVLLLPWAVSYVVASVSWIWIYDGEFGVLNYILRQLGLISGKIFWLTDPAVTPWAMLLVLIWLQYPFVTMMLLAGLQAISKELYEAAAIDGAGVFRRFWSITMPDLRGPNTVVIVLTILWAFRMFTIPYTMTGGGPVRSTETLVVLTYRYAFTNYDMGMASALGIITLIIISLLTLAYFFVLKRRGGSE